MDLVNGVLTSSVTVSNLGMLAVGSQIVNASVSLVYRVSDLSGNMAAATRVVMVVITSVPVISLSGASSVFVQAQSVYTPYMDAGFVLIFSCIFWLI